MRPKPIQNAHSRNGRIGHRAVFRAAEATNIGNDGRFRNQDAVKRYTQTKSNATGCRVPFLVKHSLSLFFSY